jgi:hypothetical protein
VQPSLPAGGAIHALALVESPTRTRLVVGGTGWLARRSFSGGPPGRSRRVASRRP